MVTLCIATVGCASAANDDPTSVDLGVSNRVSALSMDSGVGESGGGDAPSSCDVNKVSIAAPNPTGDTEISRGVAKFYDVLNDGFGVKTVSAGPQATNMQVCGAGTQDSGTNMFAFGNYNSFTAPAPTAVYSDKAPVRSIGGWMSGSSAGLLCGLWVLLDVVPGVTTWAALNDWASKVYPYNTKVMSVDACGANALVDPGGGCNGCKPPT